jgi:methylated-DNA-[protein]-cysteine S-methyltransferase
VAKLRTPTAVLGVCTAARGTRDLSATDERAPATSPPAGRARLEQYLADPEFRFTVPLALAGTPFQRRVWQAIEAIPPGQSTPMANRAR